MDEPRIEQSGARLVDALEGLQFSDQAPQARLLCESQDMRLVGFALRAGQEIKEHRSPGQLLAQVIDGSLVFTVSDQPYVLRAGMILQVGAGIPHQLRATSDTVLLLVIAPNPARPRAESQEHH